MFSDVGGLKLSFVVLVLLTNIVGSADKTLELPPNLPLKKKRKKGHNLLFVFLFFKREETLSFQTWNSIFLLSVCCGAP